MFYNEQERDRDRYGSIARFEDSKKPEFECRQRASILIGRRQKLLKSSKLAGNCKMSSTITGIWSLLEKPGMDLARIGLFGKNSVGNGERGMVVHIEFRQRSSTETQRRNRKDREYVLISRHIKYTPK